MDKIKAWLEGNGPFEKGMELFGKYNRNKHIERYLIRKQDRAKLRYELEKIVRGGRYVTAVSRPAESAIPEKPNENLKVLRPGQIRVDDMPPSVKTIYLEVCDIYKRMRSLHEKMKLVPTDNERAAVRLKLVEMEQKRCAAWEIIDRWATDGILPQTQTNPGPVPTDPKAVISARASITRNLGLLAKATDPVRIEELKERLRRPVEIILASGGGFDKNAAKLEAYGLL